MRLKLHGVHHGVGVQGIEESGLRDSSSLLWKATQTSFKTRKCSLSRSDLLKEGGLSPETLRGRKLKEAVWGRGFRDKGWRSQGLGDGRFRVLISRCALVGFA